MYLAMIERRLRRRDKDVGAESNLLNDLGFNLYVVPPVSGHEVGHVFQSEGSCQDKGPKQSSGGVG